MEQGKKNCPYCGEEIMATAKKCRHCGEWLTNIPSFTHTFQKTTQKDSCLKSHCLYDRQWMNILFGVTIIAILIAYLSLFQIIESYLTATIGILFASLCDILFLFLLMKAIPHMSRLLNIHFIVVLTIDVFLCILFMTMLTTGINNEDGFVLGQFLEYTSDIIMALLGLQLVLNYGGIIKQTGWIIIAYYIVSLVWSVIEDEISNMIAFIFSFALDYFYYIYMRNLLSKN